MKIKPRLGKVPRRGTSKCLRCKKFGPCKRECPENDAITRGQRHKEEEWYPWMDALILINGAQQRHVRVLDGKAVSGMIEFYWGRGPVRSRDSYEVQLPVGKDMGYADSTDKKSCIQEHYFKKLDEKYFVRKEL